MVPVWLDYTRLGLRSLATGRKLLAGWIAAGVCVFQGNLAFCL